MSDVSSDYNTKYKLFALYNSRYDILFYFILLLTPLRYSLYIGKLHNISFVMFSCFENLKLYIYIIILSIDYSSIYLYRISYKSLCELISYF